MEVNNFQNQERSFLASSLSPIASDAEDRLDGLDCSNISKNSYDSEQSDDMDHSFGNSRGSSLHISTHPTDFVLSCQEEASLWFQEPEFSGEEEASFLFEARQIQYPMHAHNLCPKTIDLC
jgi:hypothetical protein